MLASGNIVDCVPVSVLESFDDIDGVIVVEEVSGDIDDVDSVVVVVKTDVVSFEKSTFVVLIVVIVVEEVVEVDSLDVVVEVEEIALTVVVREADVVVSFVEEGTPELVDACVPVSILFK